MATLQTIGPIYRRELQGRDTITPGEAVDLFVRLYDEIKVRTISLDDPENDELVCLGSLTKERGKEEFVFGLTRTLHNWKSHIFYGLTIDLWYDADTFRKYHGVGDYCEANQSPGRMRERIRSTTLFKELSALPPQKYDFHYGRSD